MLACSRGSRRSARGAASPLPSARLVAMGLALSLAPIGSGEARGEDLDAFLARLAAQSQKTRTLEVRFTQRKKAALFKSEIRTQGLILFRSPDRLRWETFAPDAATLLVLGQRAELRLPGEAARTIDLSAGGALASLCGQLLVWLGARPTSELKRDYSLALQPAGTLTRLRLSPRAASLRKHVAALALTFDRSLELQTIEVEQPGGDRTTIELSRTKRNAPLPANAFR